MPKTGQENNNSREEEKARKTPVAAPDTRSIPSIKNKRIDRRFVLMGIITTIGFLCFFVYLVYVGEISPRIFAGSSARASLSKSLIFAYPLTISSNGEKSSVSVFVVSEDGDPIGNKPVIVNTNIGTVQPITMNTDSNGNAKFEFSSNTPGIAELAIVADDMKLTQTVSIEVRGQ